jgi:hypothetical protein
VMRGHRIPVSPAGRFRTPSGGHLHPRFYCRLL